MLGQPAAPTAPDVFEIAESLATACAGETWQWFVRNILDDLAQLTPETLAALSAALFFRCANDQGRFCICLAHEMRLPEDQRRTPRQLLDSMMQRGFRPPSTVALRNALAAFGRELQQPPKDPAIETALRLAHLRGEVHRVLCARAESMERAGHDQVFSDHVALMQAFDAGERDLTADELDEIEELCSARYASLATPEPDAISPAAAPASVWLN